MLYKEKVFNETLTKEDDCYNFQKALLTNDLCYPGGEIYFSYMLFKCFNWLISLRHQLAGLICSRKPNVHRKFSKYDTHKVFKMCLQQNVFSAP